MLEKDVKLVWKIILIFGDRNSFWKIKAVWGCYVIIFLGLTLSPAKITVIERSVIRANVFSVNCTIKKDILCDSPEFRAI